MVKKIIFFSTLLLITILPNIDVKAISFSTNGYTCVNFLNGNQYCSKVRQFNYDNIPYFGADFSYTPDNLEEISTTVVDFRNQSFCSDNSSGGFLNFRFYHNYAFTNSVLNFMQASVNGKNYLCSSSLSQDGRYSEVSCPIAAGFSNQTLTFSYKFNDLSFNFPFTAGFSNLFVENCNISTGDIINNQNQNTQDIINNQNQNTQDIINNQNQNNQNIINNQNQNNQNIINNNRNNTNKIIQNNEQNTQDIIDNQNQNNQNIINNNTNNTNQIIQNSEQNTQDIINNQNSNSEKEIESQKVCTYIDKNKIVQNGYFNSNGQIITNNVNSPNNGITDYIPIYDTSEIILLTKRTSSNTMCFYDINKEQISCLNTTNLTLNFPISIPSGSSYFRATIRLDENKPTFNICQNGNQALNDSVNGLNDTLNSEQNPNTNQDINDMNNMVASDTPISDLITMPLTLINAYINGVGASCSPVNLGSLLGTNLTIPCINIQKHIGSNLWNTIDILCCIFLCYEIAMLFISAFDGITSLRDDFEGLYQPKHAYTGYVAKHGGGD